MGKAPSGTFFFFFKCWVVFLSGGCWKRIRAGKAGEAKRGRCCCAALGESGHLEHAGASQRSWKWGLFIGLVGLRQLLRGERLNPTI